MSPAQLLAHFDRISEAPGAVARLRRFVLDLAVRGKLVEQDLEDRPVTDLLERIQACGLRAEPRHHSKGTPRILDQGPWVIPPAWCWVRLGELVLSRDGERIPVSKEERSKRAKNYDYYGASGAIDKIDGYLFEKPLLLIGEDGANLINRSTPIAFIARGKYWVNNHGTYLTDSTKTSSGSSSFTSTRSI